MYPQFENSTTRIAIIYNRNIFKASELCKKCLPWWWVRWEQDIEDDIRYWRFAIVPFDRVCRLDRSWFWCPMHNKGLARPRSHHMTWIKEEHFVKKVLSVNLSCYRPLWNLYLIWDQRDFAEKVHAYFVCLEKMLEFISLTILCCSVGMVHLKLGAGVKYWLFFNLIFRTRHRRLWESFFQSVIFFWIRFVFICFI